PPNDPARMAIVDPFQSVVVSLPVVRGTASDLLAGIDAARFRLRDKEAAGNPYWTTNGQWEVKSDDDPVVWLSPDAYAPGVPVTTTTWSWNKPGGLTWLSNNLYELNVKAGDRAGNWSTVYSTRSFRLDADPPMVLIKGPSQNSLKLNFDYQANTLATLSGTAQDVLSLMQRVEVEIRDLTYPSTYWHTSYWAPNSSWSVTADGGGAPLVNWNYDIPIDSMTSGRRYTIRARAVDEPGNVTASGNYSVRSDLLMDFTNPISTITLPAPGQIITEGFVTIEGTATDPAGPGGAGAGINRVEYRLKRVVPSPERFWTGSDWSATSVEPSDYPDGTLGTPPAWAHTFSGIIPWVDNGKYELTSRVVDDSVQPDESAASGNKDWPVGSPPWSHVFYYDATKPRTDFTNIQDGFHYNVLTAIAGTADDDGNNFEARRVQFVKVHLYDEVQDKTFNGVSWATTIPDPSYAGDLRGPSYWYNAAYAGVSSGTWSLAIPDFQHTIRYRVIVKAVDGGNNFETDLSTVTFVFDQYRASPEKPDSMLTEPDDQVHYSTMFSSITGTAYDDVRGELTQVKLRIRRLACPRLGDNTTYFWDRVIDDWNSEDADANVEKWPYVTDGFGSDSASWEWGTPQAAGAKARFWVANRAFEVVTRTQDKAGNMEVKYSTVVFAYDISVPTATITFPQNLGYISESAYISGTADDVGVSTVTKVELRVKRDSDGKYMDLSIPPVGDWVASADGAVWNEVTPGGEGPWTWSLSTAPWVSGVTYEANARATDQAAHRQVTYSTVTFGADFQKPTTRFQKPVDGEEPMSLPTLSGTAADAGPAGINKVYAAYRHGLLNKWWNRTTRLFDGNEPGAPGAPGDASAYWVQSTTDTLSPVNWYVTNPSTPSFTADVTYQVMTAALDKAANLEDQPGAPGPDSNRISFIYRAPRPLSGVIRPSADNVHLTPAGSTLSGTANDVSDTVEVQVQDITDPANPTSWDAAEKKWKTLGPPDNYITWQAATWAFPYWSFAVPPSSFTSLHKYQVQSKGRNIDYEEGSPLAPRTFYIDADNPAAGFLMPDSAYRNFLPGLSGTAIDASVDGPVPPPQAAPLGGAAKTVFLRLRRGADYWDGTASAWTGSASGDCYTAPDGTCLTPSYAGGVYSVNHASFTDGTAFTPGTPYEAAILIKDAAGNAITYPRSFTWDTTTPNSGVVRPPVQQKLNALPLITGTASDLPYVMKASSISLRNVSKNRCYSGSGSFNQDCPYWLETSSDASGNWSYTDIQLNGTLQAVNTWYVLLVKPVDMASNENTAYADGVSSRTFLMDTVKPLAGVNVPVDEGNYQNGELSGVGNPLTGTVSDPNSPWNSGVRRVSIRLSYNDLAPGDTWYWLSGPKVWSSGTAAAVQGMF
ncbi:MAG TPA: hypothetical protein DD417_04725, partial [Elusimicrobia bacterium]|nr:hypothetical protein [Elusimicrobiota bacterium]